MLSPRLVLLALALSPVLPAATPADSSTITQAELVRRTQILYDAVGMGDRKPWDEFYADDALYFDEKGRSMDKKALLEDLEPLPAGFSGVIKVTHPKSLIIGSTAILSYDNDETETVFGSALHARYHTTDTWLYRNGHWQIAASQTLRYYEDPTKGSPNPAALNDYLGTYQLAPGHKLTVTRQGNVLYAQSSSAPEPTRLEIESGDVFFRPGVEGRRIFHRDSTGKVDMLIDRRNNEDLIYKKIS